MSRKNKVFDPKGQKETINSLEGLFGNFVRSENQAVIDKELKLGRYAENEFGGPEAVADPLTELLREGARDGKSPEACHRGRSTWVLARP